MSVRLHKIHVLLQMHGFSSTTFQDVQQKKNKIIKILTDHIKILKPYTTNIKISNLFNVPITIVGVLSEMSTNWRV